MKIALLGLAQSGKRTFFSLLAGKKVVGTNSGNLEGVAQIKDARVTALARLFNPRHTKYAENNIVLAPDVIMESGSESSRTNKRPWLDTARRCDLLCVLLRDFNSDEVYHPCGTVNAARDHSLLETEFIFADLELMENRLQRINRDKKAGQTAQQVLEEQTLIKIKATLENEMRWQRITLSPHELESVKNLNLLALKPCLWIYNVDENGLAARAAAVEQGTFVISCRIEEEIMAFETAEERQDYFNNLGVSASGLDRLNQAAYDLMGLMSFYTVGPDEVRAWTIRKGTLAPAAAGKVHTDLERGFIRVEVIKYDDLLAARSEAAAKAQGKMQLRGRDYVIEDGDICHFLFNV